MLMLLIDLNLIVFRFEFYEPLVRDSGFRVQIPLSGTAASAEEGKTA
jgi:hypothetical protein